MEPSLQDTFSLLVSEDPEAQALRILGRVVLHTNARGGAVLTITAQGLGIFVSRGTTMAGIDRVRALWQARRQELFGKRLVQEGSDTLLHLGGDVEPVGLLHLEGGVADRAALEPYLAALSAAMTVGAQREGPMISSGGPRVSSENRKDRLVRVLEDVEWNIAFTARRFGVSRRTIYLWLERYGLSRPGKSSRGNALVGEAEL